MGPKVAAFLAGGLVLALTAAGLLEPAVGQGKAGKKKGTISLTPTEKGGWKVEINGEKKAVHVFTGKVTALDGGNINGVNGIADLDPGDFINVDGRQEVLQFRLTNKGKDDHFSFRFTPETKKFTCEIQVDGRGDPGAIYVRGKNPEAASFTLKAHPNNAEKDKKKK